MARITDARAADHLVKLITNQDTVCQGWVNHLITIQAALVVALGFLIRPIEATGEVFLPSMFKYLICGLGILSDLTLCAIICRERWWQGQYVQRYQDLDQERKVFLPKDGRDSREGEEPGWIGRPINVFWKSPGWIGRVIIGFAVFIAIGWILAWVRLP